MTAAARRSSPPTLVREGAGRGRRGARELPRRRARRHRLRAAVRVHPRRGLRPQGPHRAARRLRHRRRRHRAGPHRDRLRRGRLPPRRAGGPDRGQPGPARRHLRRAHRPLRRALGQGRRPRPHRGPARPRPAAARRGLRALLSALLALRHAAALLRQALLVHRHQPDQGPPAGLQRGRQLAPGARQARALRQLAGGQRRLGAVARALLGHAAAGVALRPRLHEGDGLAGRARARVGRQARRPPPPVRRRRGPHVRQLRRGHAPRARGDRRLV